MASTKVLAVMRAVEPLGLPAPGLAPPRVGDLILYLPCAAVVFTVEVAVVGLVVVVITLFSVLKT